MINFVAVFISDMAWSFIAQSSTFYLPVLNLYINVNCWLSADILFNTNGLTNAGMLLSTEVGLIWIWFFRNRTFSLLFIKYPTFIWLHSLFQVFQNRGCLDPTFDVPNDNCHIILTVCVWYLKPRCSAILELTYCHLLKCNLH